MPACAYCKSESKMTREHVIPSFLYQFQYELSKLVVGWNEVAEKMLPGEFKVKDVCQKCNNEKLGELDNKGKSLLLSSGVMTSNYLKRSIKLQYDFDDLVRWLLKISFNSSRTDGAHTYMFEPHIPYMLEGKNRIKRSQIALIGYMAAPLNLHESPEYRNYFSAVPIDAPTFNPFLVRIGYGRAIGRQSYQLRMVTFGALVFMMMVFDDDISPGHAAVEIRHLIKDNPGSVEVTPKSKLLQLHAGHRTWLDLYADQVHRLINLNQNAA